MITIALRRMLLGIGILLVSLGAMLTASLALVDAGLLDRPLARWASRASGHSVRFGALRTHLLSRSPAFELQDVRIANPAGLPAGDLALVHRLVGKVRLSGLLSGLGIYSLHLDGVSLSLIRFGPDRNNWAPAQHRKGGPPFAALAGVEDFSVTGGRLRFHDLARNLDVTGPFSVGQGPAAFRFRGSGSYLGAPIDVGMAGGPLHGAAVGRPYPFSGRLIDGHTRIDVQGATAEPFDLSTYRLSVGASGPNLADIGYLFHLITPNTPPYRLTAIVNSGKGFMRVGRIDVRSGSSHITGKIWSNHNDPRRDIRARFRADRLDRAEIDAMLSPIPSRMTARDRSGAVPPGPPSRFIISPAPLGLARLRATDLDFDISVGSLTGYALPFQTIVTRIDLDHGLLGVPRFSAGLFGGTVNATASIDVRPVIPRAAIATRFVGLRLAQIGRGAGGDGEVAGQVSVAGSGISLHAAAAQASGSGWLRVANAAAPKAAGWLIGGDLLRAAAAHLGAPADTAINLSALGFQGAGGHFRTTSLTASSPAGTASGDASIDLGDETFCATLDGRPARHKLFQVSAPFRVSGPWLAPRVAILPNPKAGALGLRGKVGLALSPLAALLPIRGAVGRGRPPGAYRSACS